MDKLFDKLYKDSKEEFYELVKKDIASENKRFIITANPETFNIAIKKEEFYDTLMDKDTVLIPDGIGIVKAANIQKYNVKERITGIDLAEYLLKTADEKKLRVALLGAKEEVISKLKEKINNELPNINIVECENGYIKDKDAFFDKLVSKNPDIVLVALGIPYQEELIYKHLNRFKKGIFVGVGGSFDVLSGTKKRAPKIFQKLNLEWLYRIAKEPKRIKRFWDNNVKFLIKVCFEKRGK